MEAPIPPPAAAGETSNNGRRKRRRQARDVLLEEAIDEAGSRLAGRGKSIRALRQQAKNRSYDETLIDQMFEKQLGALRKKKRPVDVDKEVDVEAMIGAAIGFPRESLTEEEIEAGVVATLGGEEQANYVIVRNHILARWRDNVNAWLSEQRVMESIRSQHKSLVSAAYTFLLSYGYINFGVAPAMRAAIPAEATRCSVVIVGAGLAGLAAARQLRAFGHKVVVVEGRHRPGGRVYTKRMEGGGQVAAADLGGSVVTGMHGNPLGVIARQLGLPLHKIRDKCPLYQPGGAPVNEDADLKVEGQFNKLLDLASKWREEMDKVSDSIALGTTLEHLRHQGDVARDPQERQLFDWHLANLEYANAGLLSNLSLAYWDQDDPYEMGGDHCFVPGGNVRLVAALAEDVPVFYGKTVHTIRYGSSGVQVLTADQIFEADMALCTVPLGVLKKRSVTFEPELPPRKYEAVDRLGFGLLNKVAMLFPVAFWGSELDTFGQLTDTPARRGEFFLFYSYAAVSGGPLLIALVAGEAAINFERMPPLEAIQRVLGVLRGIYQPRGVVVPDPIQTVCTRWGSDPLCFGSYSNVAVGASGEDYDILAESVGGRLFFAGEATTRRYPATMHGAFLSGLREAGNIAAQAAARGSPAQVPRKDIQSYATVLSDIFREPDVDFGNFAVVYDPSSQDPSSCALLRVVIGNKTKARPGDSTEQPKPQPPPLHLYTMITRQQALELREVRGGDKKRLLYLCSRVGVKLVGRRGLGSRGDAIIAALKWSRSTKDPAAAQVAANGSKTTSTTPAAASGTAAAAPANGS
ncbi:protein FLOWERING LOCUS D [Selaginella moellendorffii]|uniref:protein FLOWERING LOCUS D n=1 Tax=Selaginella moellendorffii TaxID=88036 RepID=UPI000D1C2A53|nr:protein FLOWERING LOCUS D [Selaginella moellendorffii]|eukprot:XP_002981558.2 protein FLOWERING LOCUS D [Selaginella moellendorffii]